MYGELRVEEAKAGVAGCPHIDKVAAEGHLEWLSGMKKVGNRGDCPGG